MLICEYGTFCSENIGKVVTKIGAWSNHQMRRSEGDVHVHFFFGRGLRLWVEYLPFEEKISCLLGKHSIENENDQYKIFRRQTKKTDSRLSQTVNCCVELHSSVFN